MLLPLLLACSGAPEPAPPAEVGAAPVRIGWQTTWATQGQLVAVLMHTDILQRQGLAPEFIGFTYGGPLNEGALTGGVDVVLTADQPALALTARDPSWGVVGRLMVNRVGTFVATGSPVTALEGLRGGRVAVPFGAAAHRETLGALQGAGLTPGGDVEVVNLGIQEIVALVGGGEVDGRFGAIDAAGAWDPAFADLEESGRVRTLASATVTSLVLVDDDWTAAHPGADRRLMLAMKEAWDWYRLHPAQADAWFAAEAKVPFNPGVLARAASVEPNLSAASFEGVSVALSDDDVAAVGQAGAFMVEAGLLQQPVDLERALRPLAREALPAVDSAGAVVLRP